MTDVLVGADAPVVTEAPAADPATVQDATAAPVTTPDGETTPEAKPERTFTQSELDEHIQKRLAKESRRFERVARAEAEATLLRKQLAELQAPKPEQAKGRPKLEAFGNDFESYTEAVAEWKLAEALASRERDSGAEREQRAVSERSQSVRAKLLEGASEFDDFEDVVYAPDVKISEPMAAAIAESLIPSKLAYHVCSNREEAARISLLPPTQQVREIAKIEARLTALPKPTKAPAPIEPTAGKSATERDLGDLDYDEFVKRREKQISARRR